MNGDKYTNYKKSSATNVFEGVKVEITTHEQARKVHHESFVSKMVEWERIRQQKLQSKGGYQGVVQGSSNPFQKERS